MQHCIVAHLFLHLKIPKEFVDLIDFFTGKKTETRKKAREELVFVFSCFHLSLNTDILVNLQNVEYVEKELEILSPIRLA